MLHRHTSHFLLPSLLLLLLPHPSCPLPPSPPTSTPTPPLDPTRALALDTWESLTDGLSDNLSLLASSLRTRDFPSASRWFSPAFHGDPAIAGDAHTDRPAPFLERTTWKRPPHTKRELVGPADSLAPLASLLHSWRAVDHAAFTVPDALFYDRDGHTGAARVTLVIGGRDATDRATSLSLTWDLCLERDGPSPSASFRFGCLGARGAELTTALQPLFVDATPALGVASSPSRTPRGVAAGDVDGDGLCDLFLPGPGGLLLSRDGHFSPTGLTVPTGTACLLADLDNDGDLDLVVATDAPPGILLFENTGDGFRSLPSPTLDAGGHVTALVAADFDNDGRLDLFACRNPGPDRLFLQTGALRFRECAAERGLADPRGSVAAAAANTDGSGFPSLFVARASGPSSYFENDGTAHYRDRAGEVGLADSGQAHAADWGDWDGDGQLDLHVAGVSSPIADRILSRLFGARPADGPGARVRALADGDALYLRRRGHFDDGRKRAGVSSAGWAYGGGFVDFDNDGRLDLFDACGFLTGASGPEREGTYWRRACYSSLPVPASIARPPASPDSLAAQPPFTQGASLAGAQRDHLFWNAGRGAAVDVSAISGADDPGDGRGVAFFDDLRDGAVDVLIQDLTGPRLYHNHIGAANAWLRLELVGTESNREGIGARVRVRAGNRSMMRTISGAGSERTLLVGLEAAAQADSVDIAWPSGVSEHYGPFPARTTQRLVEGNGELGPTRVAFRRMTSSPRPGDHLSVAGHARRSAP